MRLMLRKGAKDKKGQRVKELTQMFEETEYHWPREGTVLSVDDGVAGWLIGKLGTDVLEVIPATEADKPKAAPRRITAIEEAKPAEPVKPAA